jgi:hypothetical protein
MGWAPAAAAGGAFREPLAAVAGPLHTQESYFMRLDLVNSGGLGKMTVFFVAPVTLP